MKWYIFPISLLDSAKVKKDAFIVKSLFEESDEKSYWLSKTPHERLTATELMRKIIYGYNPSTTRLQRVFEITPRPSD
jgi:hypothetical protein